MDDDGSGWHEVLVGGWDEHVRELVVERVGQLTAGWRGPLVRTLTDPTEVPPSWTETLHRVVVAAIAAETGADLDELGSQAAWACYDEVWAALAARWADGGPLPAVPLGQEPTAVRLLLGLPPAAAAAAGADVRGPEPDPLWLQGRLHVDVEGLERFLGRADEYLSPAQRMRAETLVAHVRGDRR